MQLNTEAGEQHEPTPEEIDAQELLVYEVLKWGHLSCFIL